MALTDELQLLLARATGLARRGVASLRTRGLKHTLERARLQFAPRARPAPRPLLQADTRPFAPFAVPCADAPLASIVVPVHGQWRHTLGCLRAIAAHPPACPVEVVVVDDASPDDTATHLAHGFFLRADELRTVVGCASGKVGVAAGQAKWPHS